jgi:hypothetical protein
MIIERASEYNDKGKVQRFWLFPAYAGMDTSGYSLQLNVLWWNIQMAKIGDGPKWERRFATVANTLFPPNKE